MNHQNEVQKWLESIVGVPTDHIEDPEYRRWVINSIGEVGFILPVDVKITHQTINKRGMLGLKLSPAGRIHAMHDDLDIFIPFDQVFRSCAKAIEFMNTGARTP